MQTYLIRFLGDGVGRNFEVSKPDIIFAGMRAREMAPDVFAQPVFASSGNFRIFVEGPHGERTEEDYPFIAGKSFYSTERPVRPQA